MTLKIDVFNHILPKPFFERLQQVTVNTGAIKRWLNIPFLHDVDVRFRMLEEFGDEYRQILSLSAPPIESVNPDTQITIDLATLANDSQAELVRKYPQRFAGFIASLPLNHPDDSVRELERAVTTLDALGVQIFSNVNGLPLDDTRFFPLFETAQRLRCPILLHPARSAGFADYPGEPKSKYEIWWTFGWPYETSAAMQRLVFSRLFERLPDIRIVAHHLGAMIPYFEGRVGYGLDQFGTRTADEDYEGLRRSMPERPVEYFRKFWADTAVFGSRAATVCGLAFFGTDRVVFASDAPFDPEGGPMYIRETIEVIDRLDISAADRHKIYQGNAERLFNRSFQRS
jgi:predicted TIM-barrel fold metal-dependent hydrolase